LFITLGQKRLSGKKIPPLENKFPEPSFSAKTNPKAGAGTANKSIRKMKQINTSSFFHFKQYSYENSGVYLLSAHRCFPVLQQYSGPKQH
jgi:hypothetical protein